MKCPNCRCFVPENTEYCIYCGYEMSSGSSKTYTIYDEYNGKYYDVYNNPYALYNSCNGQLPYYHGAYNSECDYYQNNNIYYENSDERITADYADSYRNSSYTNADSSLAYDYYDYGVSNTVLVALLILAVLCLSLILLILIFMI